MVRQGPPCRCSTLAYALEPCLAPSTLLCRPTCLPVLDEPVVGAGGGVGVVAHDQHGMVNGLRAVHRLIKDAALVEVPLVDILAAAHARAGGLHGGGQEREGEEDRSGSGVIHPPTEAGLLGRRQAV